MTLSLSLSAGGQTTSPASATIIEGGCSLLISASFGSFCVRGYISIYTCIYIYILGGGFLESLHFQLQRPRTRGGIILNLAGVLKQFSLSNQADLVKCSFVMSLSLRDVGNRLSCKQMMHFGGGTSADPQNTDSFFGFMLGLYKQQIQ